MEGLGFHGWTDSEILDAQNIHQHSSETKSWNINGRIKNHTVKVISVSIICSRIPSDSIIQTDKTTNSVEDYLFCFKSYTNLRFKI